MGKWIITATMPSGNRYAFARMPSQPKTFALTAIDGDLVRSALTWETKEEAEEYLAAQVRLAPKLAETFTLEVRKAEELQ